MNSYISILSILNKDNKGNWRTGKKLEEAAEIW
jgi:hypothetical protein